MVCSVWFLTFSNSEAKRVMDSVRKNVRVKPKVFRISKSRSPSSSNVSPNPMTAIDDQSQQRLKELPEQSNSNDLNVSKSPFELTIRNQLLWINHFRYSHLHLIFTSHQHVSHTLELNELPRFSLFAERENTRKCHSFLKKKIRISKLKELKMKNQRIFLLCQLVVSRGIDNEVKYILDQPFTDQNCPWVFEAGLLSVPFLTIAFRDLDLSYICVGKCTEDWHTCATVCHEHFAYRPDCNEDVECIQNCNREEVHCTYGKLLNM